MNYSTKTVRFPLAALAAASVATLAAPALQAQPTDPYGGNPVGSAAGTYDAPGAVNTGKFDIDVTVDVVSAYIFRGYEIQDRGIIIQPGVEVTTDLGDTGFDLTAGIWNSFQTDHTVTSSAGGPRVAGSRGPSAWEEVDFYVGTSYELDQFVLSAKFTGYYSPGGYLGDIEEISFTAQYDDSAYLEEWAVNPYATLAFEIRDSNGSEDIYLELGGAVDLPFVDSETLPVELSFPFALGFSIDDYYTDAGGGNEVWGFLKLGAQATMDLDMIPSDYGTWTGVVGLDLWFTNDDANLLDNGDGFQPVLRAGVAMSY